jgi:hypothetical protein
MNVEIVKIQRLGTFLRLCVHDLIGSFAVLVIYVCLDFLFADRTQTRRVDPGHCQREHSHSRRHRSLSATYWFVMVHEHKSALRL